MTGLSYLTCHTVKSKMVKSKMVILDFNRFQQMNQQISLHEFASAVEKSFRVLLPSFVKASLDVHQTHAWSLKTPLATLSLQPLWSSTSSMACTDAEIQRGPKQKYSKEM